MEMSTMEPQKLIHLAIKARQYAYAPYSNYQVGAALLTESGRVFTGANVENAVYPLGLCAERVAVFKAVSEGEQRFQAIAVATANGGSPCGACRQVLFEFAPDLLVFVADASGQYYETRLTDLLPAAFGVKDLSEKET